MDNIHHGIQEHSPPQTENHSGLVLHALDLLTDRSGDLNLCVKTDDGRSDEDEKRECVGRGAGDLWVPLLLTVSWSDPTDDHFHSLAGHRVVPLRELQELVGLDFLRFPDINKPNYIAGKQAVASVRDRQDLHPAGRRTWS